MFSTKNCRTDFRASIKKQPDGSGRLHSSAPPSDRHREVKSLQGLRGHRLPSRRLSNKNNKIRIYTDAILSRVCAAIWLL